MRLKGRFPVQILKQTGVDRAEIKTLLLCILSVWLGTNYLTSLGWHPHLQKGGDNACPLGLLGKLNINLYEVLSCVRVLGN